MSNKKQYSRRIEPTSVYRNRNSVAPKQRNKLIELYQVQHWDKAESMARELTKRYPEDPFAWKSLGIILLESGKPELSLEALNKAQNLDAGDPEVHNAIAHTLYRLGRAADAVGYLEKTLELKPSFQQARQLLIKLLYEAAGYDKALEQVEIAERHFASDSALLFFKAQSLIKLGRYSEGIRVHETAVARFPDEPAHLANLANVYRSIGLFKEAEDYFRKALEISSNEESIFSSLLTSMHYNPDYSAEDLYKAHLKWDSRFRPPERKPRPTPDDLSYNRRLRIGMISAGFCVHPVGQMITSALEALPREEFEIFAYTMTHKHDGLTRRIQLRADHWFPVTHLDALQLADKVREDRIDILLDLSGHTEGNRLLTIAHEPAPLHVKWVGGLLNTTGLTAMDYLISDAVETPPGVDHMYTEKLIRLPDDYICYFPRGDAPDVSPLPALENGYITFGCFNNPSKLNDIILGKWAAIMRQIPESRLFLKGAQFSSEEFAERIRQAMERHGIERHRLILEGHSKHTKLLASYNRVDIALDPWPYSGGLTTCEALLMGVPVITHPGPSFAGRHSATHLINAGLPELVADSWENYEALAIELASDLDSLSTIRRGLRQQLKQSPVCDYKRFAKHLGIALRAIWQRYCEGKAPAALTFNKEGQAWFEGEKEPVNVKPPLIASGNSQSHQTTPENSVEFEWQLSGKIIAIDNGPILVRESGFENLLNLNAFGVLAFDPGSQVENPARFEGVKDMQLFPHALLGNGQPGTFYACLAPELSGTLKPLSAEQLPEEKRQATQVIATLPISTVALDSIQGLQSIDWLILDHLHDATSILEHGEQALRDTLLIQVRIAFQPTHERQPNLSEISYWMSRHGFRFYRLNNLVHRSYLPEDNKLKDYQATELESADALFLPSRERVEKLSDAQKTKLAFLLHTVYGVKDLTYSILNSVDSEKAKRYLQAEGILEIREQPDSTTTSSTAPQSVADGGTESKLTLPTAPQMSEAERALFRKALQNARHYFEFGSGGSTVWAAEQGLTVYGVESDAKWVSALKDKLGERCQVKAVDIGPTGDWGYPLSVSDQHKFPNYSRAIHDHDIDFDLILVDGRFRVACTLSAIEYILTKNSSREKSRIFIHDFWNRNHYHAVLEFLDTEERVESAGIFSLKPNINLQRLKSIWKQYSQKPE